MYVVSTPHVSRYGPTFHSRVHGHRKKKAISVENMTIQSDLKVAVM